MDFTGFYCFFLGGGGFWTLESFSMAPMTVFFDFIDSDWVVTKWFEYYWVLLGFFWLLSFSSGLSGFFLFLVTLTGFSRFSHDLTQFYGYFFRFYSIHFIPFSCCYRVLLGFFSFPCLVRIDWFLLIFFFNSISMFFFFNWDLSSFALFFRFSFCSFF